MYTLPRMEALHDAWDLTPRPDAFIAAYFKWKPLRPKNKKQEPKPRDLGDLIKLMGVQPGQTVTGTLAGEIKKKRRSPSVGV